MANDIRTIVARANAYGYLHNKETRMSKVLKLKKGFETFPFGQAKGGGGGSHNYKWDEWFDGQLHLLERSDGPENEKGTIEAPTTMRDYGVPQDAMFPKTKTAARRRYKVVQMSKRDFDGAKLPNAGIILQARDMDADERLAEDVLRAEEKQKAKDRKHEDDDQGGSDIEPTQEPAQG